MKACTRHNFLKLAYVFTTQSRPIYKAGGAQEARKASGTGALRIHVFVPTEVD